MIRQRTNLAPVRFAHRAAIDALESRRLLTFTVAATAGNDVIEVMPASQAFTLDIFVNAQPVGTTGDTDVRISGLGGNDLFIMRTAPAASSGIFDVKMIGGPGDDVYHLGNGRFNAANFFGIVRLEEQAGEGSDSLFIDHTMSVSPASSTSVRSDRIGDAAFFDDNVELKQIDCSDGNDNVTVDGVPSGLQVQLGNGTNNVTFGGSAKKIDGELAVGVFTAGSGVDNAIFDDSGGDVNVHRDYPISAAGILNQTLVGFEQAELRVRRNHTGTPNSILMSGTGAAAAIKFVGTSIEANDTAPRLSIGTPASPIDWDDFALQVNAAFQSDKQIQYEVWDEDNDQSGSAMILDADSTHQVVQKGGMTAQLINGSSLQLSINGGGFSDLYQVKKMFPLSRVTVNGGAGDDRLQMGAVNDLDAVFVGLSFSYFGAGGVDTLDLNDVGDLVGDADDYVISDAQIAKGDFGTAAINVLQHGAVENLLLHCDPDRNRVFLDLSAFSDVEISGDGGDDTFFNRSTVAPTGVLNTTLAANVRLHGGSGIDILSLDDSAGPDGDYSLTATQFSYSRAGLARLILFDGFSTVELGGSDQDNVAEIRQKPAGATLNFAGGGGNDVVTIGGGDLVASGVTSSNTTVSGGDGNDSIRFDDQLSTAGKTYTFDNFTLTAGAVALLYGGFESQTLDASTSTVLFTSNTVNINASSSQITSTTINGGLNRSCTVNVSNGNLVNVSPNIAVNLHNLPFDRLVVNDQDSTGADRYTITSTQLIKTNSTGSIRNTIDYAGVKALTLNANQGINDITVNSTAATVSTTINDLAGTNSSYHLGGGNVGANLLGPVTVNGPGGSSTGVVFENASDTAPSTQTLNGGAFADGQTHTVSNVSSIYIQDGGGGGTLQVLRSTIGTNIAEAFNKVVTVGNGNLDANLLGAVSIIGASSVVVDDRNDSGNDSYIVDAFSDNTNTSFRKSTGSGATVGMNFCGAAILQCNPGDNVITVNNCGPNTQIFGNGGNDRFDVLSTKPNLFAAANTLGVSSGAENSTVSPFGDILNVSGNSRVQLAESDALRNLSVSGSNAKFVAPAGITCSALALTLTGVIDLAGGALLFPNGGPSPATLRTLVTRGYNNGGWNGTNASGAINSSLAASSALADAIGYGVGSEIVPTSIGPFAIAPGDVLLRYTDYGDADLNGSVNFDDYSRIDNGFSNNRTGWVNGDFNYDNVINFDDYALIDLAFNAQGSPLVLVRQSKPPLPDR